MKLSEEDIAYLKGLDSKKKQRKFLLDRLLESVIGESAKIDYGKFENEGHKHDLSDNQKRARYLLPHEHEEMMWKFKEFDLGKMSIDEARELLQKGEIDMVDFIKVASKKEDDGCVKISGLPSTEINDHVKVFHTNTTAPRTLEGFPHQYKIDDEAPSIIDKALKELWDSAIPKKKEEFLKFDMLEAGKNVNLYDELCEWFSQKIDRTLSFSLAQELESIFLKYHESSKEKEFSKYESYLIDESNHLTWMYNRLICVYGENPNFDYMQKLRKIALSHNPQAKYTEEDLRKALTQFGEKIRKWQMEWDLFEKQDICKKPKHFSEFIEEYIEDHLKNLKNE